MSIIRCEEHGNWDSDFHEECPRCMNSEDYWEEKCERLTTENAELKKQLADSEALDCLIRYVISVHKHAFPLLHPDTPAIKNMPEHLRKRLEGK